MNTGRAKLNASGRLGGVTACAAFFLLGSMASAKVQGADGPHPAHIHIGTCDELGEIVAPLNDVAGMTGASEGSATAIPVKSNRTYIGLPLQKILDAGHAINVHLSADKIDVHIACGNIGGVIENEGGRQHVTIGLAGQNESGHTGI